MWLQDKRTSIERKHCVIKNKTAQHNFLPGKGGRKRKNKTNNNRNPTQNTQTKTHKPITLITMAEATFNAESVSNHWSWCPTCYRGVFQIKKIFLAKDIRKIIQLLAKFNSLHTRVSQNKHFHSLCQLKILWRVRLYSILRWRFWFTFLHKILLSTKVSSNIKCILVQLLLHSSRREEIWAHAMKPLNPALKRNPGGTELYSSHVWRAEWSTN